MSQWYHQSLQLPNPLDTTAFLSTFTKFLGTPWCALSKKLLSLYQSLGCQTSWRCTIFLILPQADKIELNCIIMYFSAKRQPEQFLQFPTDSFSENRTVYFYNITTINCLYLSSNMIASGKLIVILNMVFLPVCLQGKEKSRKKGGITIKPDTCTKHDLLWALRYCEFPSQRETAKLKGKYKRYRICLM